MNWKNVYNSIYDWLLSTGPRILLAVIILIIGIYLIRILNRVIKKSFTRFHFSPSLQIFFQNLIAVSLQVLLIFMILQVVGIQLTLFAAIVAGFSVAAGLALSGTLQNFVSGVLILVLKPYGVGDNISTQGLEGTVTSIQLFYTTVLTFDNTSIIIPNGQLSNNVVINLSREGNRRLNIELKFNYYTDIDHIKKILSDSIQSSKDILSDSAVRIGISKLDADHYIIIINVWVRAHGFYDAMLALNEKLITDIKNAGVKLPGM